MSDAPGCATKQARAAIRGPAAGLLLAAGLMACSGSNGPSAASFQWTNVPSSIQAGTPFTAMLIAKDASGNNAVNYRGTAAFTSTDGLATLPQNYTFTDTDQGQHGFEITLRTTNPAQQTVTARDAAQSSITGAATVTVTNALVYTDPAPGGKIRLIKDASSNSTTIVLKLVSAQALVGYSVGFDLPLAAGKVRANAALIAAGDALNPGGAPQPFKAVIPSTGPLANVLATVLSQKAAGAGAVSGDAAIAAGRTFYTLKLDVAPGATPGTVFNGAALGPKFRAALIDKSGDDTVRQTDFAIGKLELF